MIHSSWQVILIPPLEFGESGIRLFLNDSTIGCAAFHPGESDYYTYSSGSPEERIDYIFFTKRDFVEVDGRVMSEFGEISDHLPVMARLKFRNQVHDIQNH